MLCSLSLLFPAVLLPPQSSIEVIPFTTGSLPSRSSISADGGRAVRVRSAGQSGFERYDPALGIDQIPLPFGATSAFLRAVNASGSEVLALVSTVSGTSSIYRLDELGGATPLILPGDARMQGASNDLDVIVGYTEPNFGCTPACTAFRSDGTTSTVLTPLAGGGSQAFAFGCSADGSWVVGESSSAAYPQREACVWDVNGAVSALGVSPGSTRSIARVVNDDGSVIGGEVLFSGSQWRPARWTPAGGVEELFPSLGYVSDVSASGELILGYAPDLLPNSNWGFVWTVATGFVPWSVYLDALQVPGREDWEVLDPLAVSDDGTAFTAWGRRTAPGSPQESCRVVLDRATVGVTGCVPQNPNSRGKRGKLNALGSASVQEDRLALLASDLPRGQTCLLVAAPALGPAVSLPGSSGTLCLAGSLGRDLATIRSSGPGGAAAFPVSPGAIPQPNGPVVGMPGETWHFQVWHRDFTTAQTSNTTASISVTLM